MTSEKEDRACAERRALLLIARSYLQVTSDKHTSAFTVLTVGNIRGDLAGETCSPNILTASLTDANGAAVSISAMVDDLKFGTINWLDIRISLSLTSTQGKAESQFSLVRTK